MFHRQICSIVEALANAAVADICQLVDEGYDVLRLEISSRQAENNALKDKLLLMEKNMMFSPFYQRESGLESSWVNNAPGNSSSKSYGPGTGDHGAPVAKALACQNQNQVLRTEVDSRATREPAMRSKADVEEEGPDLLIYIKEEQPDLELKAPPPQHEEGEGEGEADKPLHQDGCRTRTGLLPPSSCDSVLRDPDTQSQEPPSSCDSVLRDPDTQSQERDTSAETQAAADNKGSTSSCGWDAMTQEAGSDPGDPDNSEASSTNALRPHYRGPGGGGGPRKPTCSYASRSHDSRMPKAFSSHGVGVRQPIRRQSGASVVAVVSKPAVNNNNTTTTTRITFPSGLSMTKPFMSHPPQRSRKERFICKQCGKGWISASGLRTHQRVHTGERPFSCQQCDKTFNQLSNLKRHVRIHAGKKPFGCDRCGDTFADRVCFAKHPCFGQS